MAQLSIGVTGHRDIRPDEQPHLLKQTRAFIETTRAQHPGEALQLLSALAEGADTLAANVAIEMDIPLLAILPMPLEHCREDFESPEALEKFESLLGQAIEIVELPAKPGADLSDQETRSWHYARMGAYVSDHSQILLAIWDGKDNHALGGTAQVVRYHLGSGMPGFVSEHPVRNDEARVYHIVASRNRANGEPLEGLQPGQERWMG